MRVLLDTHTLLWAANDSPQLSRYAQELLEDTANELILSTASLWEIAIKLSIGKLKLGSPFLEFVATKVTDKGIELLPAEPKHLDVFSTLPLHHRDPFDRLIIAQGLVEGVPILTRDGVFGDYGVRVLWDEEDAEA